MQPTITPPKTFTKKTELVFTTIEIQKLSFQKYGAFFQYGFSKENLNKHSISESNIEKLIEKVSKFLDCQIDERHYIIK